MGVAPRGRPGEGAGPEKSQASARMAISQATGAFDTLGYFDVVGIHTGRRYRIRVGTAINIRELDAFGHAIARWCFVPGEGLPAGDVMLAQKFALDNDEQSALAVGRWFEP